MTARNGCEQGFSIHTQSEMGNHGGFSSGHKREVAAILREVLTLLHGRQHVVRARGFPRFLRPGGRRPFRAKPSLHRSHRTSLSKAWSAGASIGQHAGILVFVEIAFRRMYDGTVQLQL